MSGLVFFLLIGKWYQAKVYDRLSFDKDFSSYFPISVIKIEEGNEKNTPVMALRSNDVIKILHQGIIPADCELLSEEARIDYSFVTGESRPVTISKGELIYAGGKNLNTATHLSVRNKVSQSYLTDLWNQPAFLKGKRHLSGILDRASSYFTITVLSITIITAVYWYFNDPSILLNAVTSVLIIACPCALALSVPFALGNVRRLVGKSGLFSKNTDVLEAFAETNVLIFDKTGTLTEPDQESYKYVGEVLNKDELALVTSLASQSAHPHSRVIASSSSVKYHEVTDFVEILGKGISGMVNGLQVKIGSADFVLKDKARSDSRESESWCSIDGMVKGRFLFHRKLRAGMMELLQSLQQDYKCILLSGDNDAESWLLATMFDESNMHFNMSPLDKMKTVKRLQEEGHTVAMVGDGLNDAGALQQSDVGIAVSDDVDIFSPACDIIMQGDRLKYFHSYVDYVRSGVKVVRWSMLFSILYNVVGISIAVQGLLTPLIAAILMPLSSVSIVLFATLVTRWNFTLHGLPSGTDRPTTEHAANPKPEPQYSLERA